METMKTKEPVQSPESKLENAMISALTEYARVDDPTPPACDERNERVWKRVAMLCAVGVVLVTIVGVYYRSVGGEIDTTRIAGTAPVYHIQWLNFGPANAETKLTMQLGLREDGMVFWRALDLSQAPGTTELSLVRFRPEIREKFRQRYGIEPGNASSRNTISPSL